MQLSVSPLPTNSIMLSKLRVFTEKILLPAVFWLSVWQIAAFCVDRSYFLPTVPETAKALLNVLLSEDFIPVASATLLRVLSGLLLGTAAGALLALLAHKHRLVYNLLFPALSVIKATPIASIIILLWISLNGNTLSVFVAFLMVLPIIWQNLYDGFASVDKDLLELSRSYEFSYFKRLRILILPSLKEYFIPAFITSVGLAFKSEIAAEIIAGVKSSVGQMIYGAKDAYDTAAVFAWTLVGIFFSIALESLAKFLLKRTNKPTLKGASK